MDADRKRLTRNQPFTRWVEGSEAKCTVVHSRPSAVFFLLTQLQLPNLGWNVYTVPVQSHVLRPRVFASRPPTPVIRKRAPGLLRRGKAQSPNQERKPQRRPAQPLRWEGNRESSEIQEKTSATHGQRPTKPSVASVSQW